jgi:hypothetical protein
MRLDLKGIWIMIEKLYKFEFATPLKFENQKQQNH